jgi:hypothetical protein
MAYPVILVNSATGSDTAASGAGPSTALTGTTNADTDATGLIVTLGGSPDLSGVATDGTHVLFLNDNTNAQRNFSAIVGADNSAKTVTIATGQAFQASQTGLSWAIGGVRATMNGTISGRLWATPVNQPGDAMPGWTVRMQSGHAESGGAILFRRAGDLINGKITLEGEENAATLPVYTSSGNGFSSAVGDSLMRLRNFGIKKSGSSGSIGVTNITHSVFEGIRILDNAGVKFATGISITVSRPLIVNCYIETVTGVGIVANQDCQVLRDCVIKDCGTWGVTLARQSRQQADFAGNIIYGCTSGGVEVTQTGSGNAIGALAIRGNTIHGNGGPGIQFPSTSSQNQMFQDLIIENNQITDNDAQGISFSGSGVTAALLLVLGTRIRNNNFGTGATANTSGACNVSLTDIGSDNLEVDPQYTDAAAGDFSIGTNTKALGYPLTAIGTGIVAGNRSYVDIGALQREEEGGGGGGAAFQLVGGGGLVYLDEQISRRFHRKHDGTRCVQHASQGDRGTDHFSGLANACGLQRRQRHRDDRRGCGNIRRFRQPHRPSSLRHHDYRRVLCRGF